MLASRLSFRTSLASRRGEKGTAPAAYYRFLDMILGHEGRGRGEGGRQRATPAVEY